MKKLIFLLLYFTNSFLFSQNKEENILFIDKESILNIGKQMYILEDKEYKLSIEDILKPENQKLFKKSTEDVPTFTSSSGKVWIKFTVLNKSQDIIYVEAGDPLAWYLDFYKPNLQNKLELTTKTGLMRPISNRELDDHNFMFELSNSNEPKTYYFSIESQSTFLINLKIGTLKSFYEDSYLKIFFLGIFSGFLIIMFFYNLFIYFSVRDDVYLYYCGYVFFGLFLNNFISGNYGYKWNYITYFSEYFMAPLFVSSFFIAIFLIKLLQIKKNEISFYIILTHLVLCFVFMLRIS